MQRSQDENRGSVIAASFLHLWSELRKTRLSRFFGHIIIAYFSYLNCLDAQYKNTKQALLLVEGIIFLLQYYLCVGISHIYRHRVCASGIEQELLQNNISLIRAELTSGNVNDPPPTHIPPFLTPPNLDTVHQPPSHPPSLSSRLTFSPSLPSFHFYTHVHT